MPRISPRPSSAPFASRTDGVLDLLRALRPINTGVRVEIKSTLASTTWSVRNSIQTSLGAIRETIKPLEWPDQTTICASFANRHHQGDRKISVAIEGRQSNRAARTTLDTKFRAPSTTRRFRSGDEHRDCRDRQRTDDRTS